MFKKSKIPFYYFVYLFCTQTAATMSYAVAAIISKTHFDQNKTTQTNYETELLVYNLCNKAMNFKIIRILYNCINEKDSFCKIIKFIFFLPFFLTVYKRIKESSVRFIMVKIEEISRNGEERGAMRKSYNYHHLILKLFKRNSPKTQEYRAYSHDKSAITSQKVL